MTGTSKNFWQDRPVFVTGATGLLGGWLVQELVHQGADVIALVRDSVPRSLLEREGLLDRITTVRGSLEEFSQMHRALCEYSVDTVFHLAAQPLVGVAKLDPMATLESNIRGTWHVLEAARLSGARRIIVASSDKAYGPSDHLPYRETDPLCGRFPYDVSKSCADLIAGMYATTFSLPVAVVRCANLFGGGDLNFSRLIPDLIRSTLRGERFVIRSDGKFVRDFLYVQDAVSGYLLLAEQMAGLHSLAGEAFNFSLQLRLNVLEIVQATLHLIGRPDLQPVVENKASSEIREQYMDSEKARRVLGWSPRYSLEAGLRETIAWYASFFGSKVPGAANALTSEQAAAGALHAQA
jgi:CDP-glucose 4,6-dehydratase